MPTTDSESTHPGLTIEVYRINPETLERTPVRSVTFAPSDAPVYSLEFPPCECPRCGTHPWGTR
ncbi:hypothetical protein [Streptomyces sp. PSKA30]|uniref:hypothetical protein n=1 Tax=Streptomyces sp. PSKA30 TaxID=2874597 RepID=UPI001CD16C4E|nr:hypothetical protein [Streptomyces sp. PSKA30]MBZ9642353.1 hypothetical protein [Streptomyces sp. PSKA30]